MDFLTWSHQLDSQKPDSLTGRQLFLGVVVDAEEVFLFHQTLEQATVKQWQDHHQSLWEHQGVAKRSLESGKLLWIVKTPAVPLTIIDQKLWLIEGQGAKFRILTLDTETGKTLHISDWFEMLLGLPAVFDYHQRLGLSVQVETRWNPPRKQLWIRVDGETRYVGGAPVHIAIEERYHNITSLLVKVIPTTGEISLAKTKCIQGMQNFSRDWNNQQEKLPLPFPSGCLEPQPNSFVKLSSKYHLLKSVPVSHYIVTLEILPPIERIAANLLLLRVFSADLKNILWQQYIGDYYSQPVPC